MIYNLMMKPQPLNGSVFLGCYRHKFLLLLLFFPSYVPSPFHPTTGEVGKLDYADCQDAFPTAGIKFCSFPWRAGFCYGGNSGLISQEPSSRPLTRDIGDSLFFLFFVRPWWVHDGGKPHTSIRILLSLQPSVVSCCYFIHRSTM